MCPTLTAADTTYLKFWIRCKQAVARHRSTDQLKVKLARKKQPHRSYRVNDQKGRPSSCQRATMNHRWILKNHGRRQGGRTLHDPPKQAKMSRESIIGRNAAIHRSRGVLVNYAHDY